MGVKLYAKNMMNPTEMSHLELDVITRTVQHGLPYGGVLVTKQSKHGTHVRRLPMTNKKDALLRPLTPEESLRDFERQSWPELEALQQKLDIAIGELRYIEKTGNDMWSHKVGGSMLAEMAEQALENIGETPDE